MYKLNWIERIILRITGMIRLRYDRLIVAVFFILFGVVLASMAAISVIGFLNGALLR